MIYIITVLISAILIIAGNMIFLPKTPEVLASISLSVAVGIIAIFALDGIFAFVIRRMTPKSWYRPNRRAFDVPKKEFRLYQRLGVKNWVKIVPELGGFTDFHKDSVGNLGDTERLERFILEANFGVIIHLENAIFGFLVAFIPYVGRPSVWIPIYVVNFILSIMPVAILRFNNYTLIKLYKRSTKVKERSKV